MSERECSTKLSRRFAKRYMELSLQQKYSKSWIHEILVDEFNIHEFTVKRLARETRQMCKHKNFNWMLESRLLWGRNTHALSGLREAIRDIVLSERLFFSESASDALQKNEVQKVLSEKEETDVKFREYNKAFIVSLKNYFKSGQSKFHSSDEGIGIRGKDIHPDLHDLEIVLVAKTQTGAGNEIMGTPYIGLKSDKKTQVIVMPVVSSKSKTILDVRKDFLSNFSQMEYLVSHEFGHYLDIKRYNKNVNFTSADVERKKGVKAYFNTPEEYNQYYHDGIKKFEQYADALSQVTNFELKKQTFPPSFSEFMNKFDLQPAPKKKFKDLKPWEMTKENFEELQGDFIIPNNSSSNLENLPIVAGRLYRKAKIYKIEKLLQSEIPNVIKQARESGYDAIKTGQSDTVIVLNPKVLDNRTHKDFIKQALVNNNFIQPKAIIDYSELAGDYDTKMDDLRDKVRQQMQQGDTDMSANQREEEKAVNQDTLNRIFRTDVIDSMTPATRRRFVKRLSDFYPKIVDTLYTDEEKVAIEKEYAQKKKIFDPKKIKNVDRLKHLQKKFAKKKEDQKFYCAQ